VTDADIACGFLNPEQFLGGAQDIDAKAALTALTQKIGDPMGLTGLQAAAGIRRIVDMRMADEVRVVAAKRGVDPQEFTLLPFGGAGAVHAAAVAEELGIRRILVPPRPGAFSALGLLCTDVVHDYIRSELRPLDQVAPDHAEQIFGELEARAARELAEEGLDAADALHLRELDMRYVGQGYELRVPLDGLGGDGGLDDAAMAASRERFDERHAQLHGHAAAEKSVEVVSYRLRIRVTVPRYEPPPAADAPSHDAPAAGVIGSREVYFDGETAHPTKIFDRDGLDAGARMTGPAIIEQFDATTVVPMGWTANVDGDLNLILTHG
jgi:N-methylhydantoinase A